MNRPASTLRGALRPLGLLVVVALVLPFAVYTFPAAVGAHQSYVVLSGSMEPAISPGDVILVYRVDPTRVEAGDIITFDRDGDRISTTHRVVEAILTDDDPSGVIYLTKGDANEDPDGAPVGGSQLVGQVPAITLPVVGTVVAVIPFIGYVVQFANTTVGFLLLVALPISLFVLNEAWLAARARPTVARDRRAGPGATGTPGARLAAIASPREALQRLRAAGDRGMLTIQTGDLELAIAVLAVVAAYAAWVAFALTTWWSVMAAVAAVGVLLFAVGLRRSARAALQASPPAAAASAAAPPVDPAPTALSDGGDASVEATDSRIVRSRLPPAVTDWPRVPVASTAELLAHAAAVEGLVIEDVETGAHVLVDGGLLFVATEDAGAAVDGGDEGD